MVRELPVLGEDASMRDALELLIETNLGVVMIQSRSGRLLGVISDGDVKRAIHKSETFLESSVLNVMTENPRTITSNTLAEKALRDMETDDRLITFMPVVDNEKLVGLLRLHEIIQAKIK